MYIFKAKLEFQSEKDILDNMADSITITFEAVRNEQAALITEVMRWFANRHEAVPEYFTRLCALDICGQRFSKIEPNGHLESSAVAPCFVWKIDSKRIPKDVTLESIGWKREDMDHLARVIQGVH